MRQLAGDLGINFHTVIKSYDLLRQEGLLRVNRKSGAVIQRDPSSGPPAPGWVPDWESRLRTLLAEAAAQAARRGNHSILRRRPRRLRLPCCAGPAVLTAAVLGAGVVALAGIAMTTAPALSKPTVPFGSGSRPDKPRRRPSRPPGAST